GRFAAAIAK
nr:Chain C, peptide m9 [synthetic construct]1K5N_C Chain C, nonameric model peptide m9 [synthetic construct]